VADPVRSSDPARPVDPVRSSDPARQAPLLEVAGLDAAHGNLQALWDVDLHLAEGEALVVLGANGAGKSTLLSAIGGHLPALRGRLQLDGIDITHLSPSRRARLGMILMTEQGVFPELSVRENLRLGAWRLPRRDARRSVEEVLGRFEELAGRLASPAGSLSGGQRKMLGLAKALVSRPRVLILDEPSAGLSPLYVKRVVADLAATRRDGPAMLLAEQNVAFLELADRVVVLEGGRVRFSGSVAQLQADTALADAFFGLEGHTSS
jgi:branched-chain amino acid transport system ATP-binding protein